MKSVARWIPVVLFLSLGVSSSVAEEPSEEGKDHGLRGMGILILDPRDSPEVVKERLREFLDQIRPNIPPKYREESNRRQLEALLAADWESQQNLPQLDLQFHKDVLADMIHGFILTTPIAKESEKVCTTACPFREYYKNGVHIHLTRSVGGKGDSVIALHVYDPRRSTGLSLMDQIDLTINLRDSLLAEYPDLGFDRKPVGKLFGLRVYIGDPKVKEEGMPPAISPG